MRITRSAAVLIVIACTVLSCVAAPSKKKTEPEPSPLDKYAAEAAIQAEGQKPTPGSLWTSSAQFADLGRDLKASQVNDLVTIVVTEQASAVSSGASKTQRKSNAANSVAALAGITKANGPLANLLNTSGNQQLDGSGTTSRDTSITTTMSARVTRVLPNGYLMLEGSKLVQINSEHQTVSVRGVVRPADLASDNSVPSNRLAQMEIQLNGKGVVGDAIRRPFILWRLLLGILPF
jgi:flagellar L-ring protein FlgH